MKDINHFISGYTKYAYEDKPKGTPKKDGSGGGVRKNKGRGGCEEQEVVGKGKVDKQAALRKALLDAIANNN